MRGAPAPRSRPAPTPNPAPVGARSRALRRAWGLALSCALGLGALGLGALGLGASGCGGAGPGNTATGGAGRLDPDTVDDPFAGVGRPTLQLYAVLTADPTAMQGEPAVAGMWQAVAGQGPRYGAVRRQVEWAPGDYKLNVDLDFADLPHPKVPAKAFEALAAQLPPAAAARARAAKLAIFFRSDAGLLPGGDHIRLAGLAALQAADRWDGVVYDLIARRAYTPEALYAELAQPVLTDALQTRVQARADGDTARWLLTRGEPKWGLPDLQMRRVPAPRVAAAEAHLRAARAAVRALGKAAPGDPIAVAGATVTLEACEAPPGLHDAACVQVPVP